LIRIRLISKEDPKEYFLGYKSEVVTGGCGMNSPEMYVFGLHDVSKFLF
jgi:hypothetical protein